MSERQRANQRYSAREAGRGEAAQAPAPNQRYSAREAGRGEAAQAPEAPAR